MRLAKSVQQNPSIKGVFLSVCCHTMNESYLDISVLYFFYLIEYIGFNNFIQKTNSDFTQIF